MHNIVTRQLTRLKRRNMGILSSEYGLQNPFLKLGQARTSATKGSTGVLKCCRLTLLFAVTALVAISGTGLLVNQIASDLAVDNLVRSAEKEATADVFHVQFVLRRQLQELSLLS